MQANSMLNSVGNRNGLVLCKPLEHAFDDSRIIFVRDATDASVFRLVVIDEAWRNVKLFDKAQKLLAIRGGRQDLQAALGDTTYGECEGMSLVFINDKRPFKRCLSFQAMRAVARAREEEYLPEDWDDKHYIIDYLSEGMSTPAIVKWLEDAAIDEQSIGEEGIKKEGSEESDEY